MDTRAWKSITDGLAKSCKTHSSNLTRAARLGLPRRGSCLLRGPGREPAVAQGLCHLSPHCFEDCPMALVPSSGRETQLQECNLSTCWRRVTGAHPGQNASCTPFPTHGREGHPLFAWLAQCFSAHADSATKQTCCSASMKGAPHCAASKGLWTHGGDSAHHSGHVVFIVSRLDTVGSMIARVGLLAHTGLPES